MSRFQYERAAAGERRTSYELRMLEGMNKQGYKANIAKWSAAIETSKAFDNISLQELRQMLLGCGYQYAMCMNKAERAVIIAKFDAYLIAWWKKAQIANANSADGIMVDPPQWDDQDTADTTDEERIGEELQ